MHAMYIGQKGYLYALTATPDKKKKLIRVPTYRGTVFRLHTTCCSVFEIIRYLYSTGVKIFINSTRLGGRTSAVFFFLNCYQCNNTVRCEVVRCTRHYKDINSKGLQNLQQKLKLEILLDIVNYNIIRNKFQVT